MQTSQAATTMTMIAKTWPSILPHIRAYAISAMAFLRPPGAGTMAEAVEGRVGTAVRGLGPPEDAGALGRPAEDAETTPEGVR